MPILREIAGPAGTLEARLDVPSDPPRAVAVIAPPPPQYGGTLQTRAVYEAARALGRIGVAALRFNFRGAGASAGTFDEGRGEQDDYRAALDFAAERFPGLPLWAIGMSFGAADYAHDIRLACHGLDKHDNDFVIGLIGKDLFPLSAIVQKMRGTQQTSLYLERLGPFFIGRVFWQSTR